MILSQRKKKNYLFRCILFSPQLNSSFMLHMLFKVVSYTLYVYMLYTLYTLF